MRVGVAGSQNDRIVRFERLLDRLEAEFPGEEANHWNWINYARTWAEWAALRWELEDDNASIATDRCEHLHDRIEMHFADWMQRNYASLSQPFAHAPGHGTPYTPAYGAFFYCNRSTSGWQCSFSVDMRLSWWMA